MATVFSTATLGLRVDATQLNKELFASEKVTVKTLNSMSASAAAFDTRWKDLTRGIKDTKRIISGILISQGFYALMNVLAETSAAALEFSRSMETAGVSLEYFVDSAAGSEEAAAKVKAYLREVNEFAARTPFNTDQVLSLSKYMQAVGVSMNQTQSVLSVITDTAAATGADKEQLQRITFALGQMITKGRIANEEIRQLANANVPIYEILQEEMGLTGEQISNIGKYWVDANQAVVAILNGLNKRYQGAADRIAETLTGLTDTIIDDAKIIADTAFEGIYDKIVGTARNLRDTLDYWRTLTTDKGTPGLFNDVVLEIDPSGQLGNQILATIGHVENLKESFIELYHAAAPVLSVLGKSFAASLNVGLIAVTSFTEVLSTVIEALDKAGISASFLGKSIASLYIAYKATKFVSLFGEAAAKAGMAAYTAANGLLAIVPASASASMGIRALTASVAGLITYLLAAVGLFAALNNGFAGLSADTGASGLNANWEKAYADYEAQLAEYNAAVDAYRSKYEENYSAMADGTITIVEEKDKDKNKGTSSGGGSEKEWVSAFDEVYDVPEDDGTGAYQDAVIDDLGELLNLLRPAFRFPTVGLDLPEYPEFNLGDVFGDSYWDHEGNSPKDFLRAMIPAGLLGLVMGIGKQFAKQQTTIDGISKAAESGSSAAKDAANAVERLTEKYVARSEELVDAVKRLKQADDAVRNIDSSTPAVAALEDAFKNTKRLLEDVVELSNDLRLANISNGTQLKSIKDLEAIQTQLNRSERLLLVKQLERVQAALAGTTDAIERQAKQSLVTSIEKRLAALGTTPTTALFSSPKDFATALDTLGTRLIHALNQYSGQPYTKTSGNTRLYDTQTLTEIRDLVDEMRVLLGEGTTLFADSTEILESTGSRLLGTFASFDKEYAKNIAKMLSAAEAFNSASEQLLKNSKAGLKTEGQTKALIEESFSKAAKSFDQTIAGVVALFPENYDELLAKQLEKEAEKQLRAVEAAAAKAKRDAEAAEARRLAREAALAEKAELRNKQLSVAAGNVKQQQVILSVEPVPADRALEVAMLRTELDEFQEALKDYAEAGDASQVRTILRSIADTEKQLAGLTAYLSEADKLSISSLKAEREKLGKQIVDAWKKHDDTVAAELNEQFAVVNGRLMALNDFGKGLKQLSASLSNQEDLDSLVAKALRNAMPNAPGIAEATAEATAAWLKTLNPKLTGALKKLGATEEALRMTATKTVIAATGLSDWTKSFPQLIAEIFEGTGAFKTLKPLAKLPTAIQQITDRGVLLEKYAVTAADVLLTAKDVTVYGGDHAARAGSGLVVQYDAALGGMQNLIKGAAELVAADVKTVSADVIEAIKANAKQVSDSVYQADASILKLMGRRDNFYELAAQSWVFTGDKGGQAAIFLNADFDFNEVIPNFSELLKEQLFAAFNNSAATNKQLSTVSGRIFSMDAFNLAKRLSGDKSFDFARYAQEVIAPLFISAGNKFDPAAISKAITVVYLDYAEALKTLDIPLLAKNYETAVSLISLVGDSAADYLTSYAHVVDNAGKLVTGTLDVADTIKRYPMAARNINEWLSTLLDEQIKVPAGSVPKTLQRAVDKLVKEFASDLASGMEASKAAENFRAAINSMLQDIGTLAGGGTLPEDIANIYGKMAVAPKKYYDQLMLISRALHRLADTPGDVNAINMAIGAVRTEMQRLLRSAASNTAITASQIRTVISDYEKVTRLLRLDTNALAISVGTQLQDLERKILQNGGKALISSAELSKIVLPFDFAGVGETAAYTAQAMLGAIENGLLDVDKQTQQIIKQIAGNVTTQRIEPLLQQLGIHVAALADTIIADLETVGLPVATEAGTSYPPIMQATLMSANTGKTLSSFITSGDAQQDAINLMAMQSLTNKDGSLSDVAKAWQNVTLEQIQAGMTIEEFWKQARATFGTGNGLTGWNATGVTGFDYPTMIANGLPADLFVPVEDLMVQFSSIVESVTGISKKFKLVDAYEIIYGQLEEVAHLADADVPMARKVMQAMSDGTLTSILQGVDTAALSKNISAVDLLSAAGREYRASLPTVDLLIEEGRLALPATTEDLSGEIAARAAMAARDTRLNKLADFGFDLGALSSGTDATALMGNARLYRSWAANAIQAGDIDTASYFEQAAEAIRRTSVDLFGETATAAAEAAGNMGSTFTETAGKASRSFSSLMDDLWGTSKTAFEKVKHLFTDSILFGGLNNKALQIPSITDALTDARNASTAVRQLLEDGVDQTSDVFIKASKELSDASTNLYRSIMKNGAEGLSQYDFSGSFTDWAKTVQGTNEYLAIYWDDAAKQFRTLGSNLSVTTDDIATILRASVQSPEAFGKNIAKYLGQSADDITALQKGLSNIAAVADVLGVPKTQTLQAAFNTLQSAMQTGKGIPEAIDTFAESFGKAFSGNANKLTRETQKAIAQLVAEGNDTSEAIIKLLNKTYGDHIVLIEEASGNVAFAGKTAAKAMGQAADDIAGGIGSMLRKVTTASVGAFSIFDAVGVGINAAIEGIHVNKLQDQLGVLVNNMMSAETQTMFETAGVDLSEILGDSVYKGITESLKQDLIITLFANGLGTAAAAAAAAFIASPPGWIAAAVAAVAGIGASIYVNATGGNTEAYKYYDNYQKAVQSGEFIDYQGLVDKLTAAGYSIEEATKAADEANEKAHYEYQRRILLASSTDNRWEDKNINELLHGTTSDSGVSGGNSVTHFTAATTDTTNDALRMAQVMGLINATSYTEHDVATTRRVLAIDAATAETQLDDIKKLLNDETLQLGELVTVAGKEYRTVTRTSDSGYVSTILYNDSSMDALADALSMVTVQGITSGAIAESILGTVNTNDFLSAAYNEQYGNFAEAQRILADFLVAFNAANGTAYTVDSLAANADQTTGKSATAAFLQMMVDSYEALSAQTYYGVLERQSTDTQNRNVLAGDTSQMLGNLDTASWGTSLLAELASMGLTFADNSYKINTAYGEQDIGYSTFATDYEALRENLAGVRVGDTTLADGTTLDISSLHVTAADAEILAQAGIQIQSDGTIAFMNALNEGATGATRDMSLSAKDFSKSIMDRLTGIGISIDFEAGELHFDDFQPAVDNMSSALFKLPDNINRKLADEMRESLSALGKVTDDGYLEITNKAVLNGSMTIEQFIAGLDGGGAKLNDWVRESLLTIGALLETGEGDIQANLIEWADGIVVNSPIKADQLTPDIEEAFRKLGITFSEQNGKLKMIISQTGEHLLDGMTLVDTNKWNEVDADVRAALESLGLTTTEIGNRTLVDLNGIFDGGIANIVSLFVNKPELWDQIPESIRAVLEKSGIVTHEQLIEIQKELEGGLVEISDGWVLTWDSLGPEVLEALNQAGYDTTTGLAHVSKAITDANVGEIVDGGIVVYFDDLPDEIKQSMGDTAEELKGSKVILETATDTAVGGMLGVLSDSISTAEGYATELATTIENAVTSALLSAQQLENISANVGKTSSGFLGLGSTKNTQGTTYKANGKLYVAEYDYKGNFVGYRTTDEKGVSKLVTSLPDGAIKMAATGGIVDGTTLAGELGTEMAILPDGSTKLVDAGLYDFPRGTQILNAEDTATVRKYAGNRPVLKKFAEGSTELITEESESSQSANEHFKRMLEEVLHTNAELLAISIKNAAAVIVEELQLSKTTTVEAISLSINKQTEDVTASINQAASSISSSMSSLRASMQTTARNTGYTADDTKRTASDVDTATLLLTDWAAEASKNAEAGDWDKVIDALEHRDEKIYYIGTDYGTESKSLLQDLASKYGHDTIKANAGGGLVTGDSLVRVGEFGKSEAILPLEQPGVMAKLGLAMANATGISGTHLTVETLVPVLQDAFHTSDELLAIAIKNAATTLSEDMAGSDKQLATTVTDNFTLLHTKLTENTEQIKSAISLAASSIGSVVRALQSGISVMSARNSSGGSGGSDVDRSQYGGSAFDQALMTTDELAAAATIREAASKGDISWSDAHDYVESIRDKHGYSGGGDGSKYITGSASGSLVDEDALYRAGELGLKEAIIPLERPNIMRYVGSTIASYMPTDAKLLTGALGMANAGVTMPQAPTAYMPDMTGIVDRVTQSVLESVLPAMASISTNEEKTPVYVGTLIADDRGLKQLERKLYIIRQAEEARR